MVPATTGPSGRTPRPPGWRALQLVVNHLRDPRTPGNQVEPGTATLVNRFRESATRLERFHRVCAMSRAIAERFGDLAS
ncbi:MAG: hypothetical protein WCF33_04785 [Pseudonocardiaceae bacterium]